MSKRDDTDRADLFVRIKDLEGCVKALAAERDGLASLLRELHDHQNGPPLPKYENDWQDCMQRTIAVLRYLEDPAQEDDNE